MLLGPENDKGLVPHSSKKSYVSKMKYNKLQPGWSPSPKKMKRNFKLNLIYN